MTRKADPQDLDRAAKRIDNSATEIEHLRRTLLSAARKPDWQGSGAESMRDTMNALAKDMAVAAKHLEHMADHLRIGATHLRGELVHPHATAQLVAQRDPHAVVHAEWIAQHDPQPTAAVYSPNRPA